MQKLGTTLLRGITLSQLLSLSLFAASAANISKAVPVANTSTRVQYIPIVWTVDCCQVWTALGAFTIEKTGSRLSEAVCAQQSDCSQLKLVTNFVEQTRALLGPDTITTGPHQQLHFNFSAVYTHQMLQLLALSFVGRVISVSDISSDNQITLLYDVQYDTLSITRPTCQYSKRIYSGMVLVSVCLLIFFIVMQIIEKNKHEHTIDQLKRKKEELSGIPPSIHASKILRRGKP